MNDIVSAPVCMSCWAKAKGHWVRVGDEEYGWSEVFTMQPPVRWPQLSYNKWYCACCGDQTNDGMFTNFNRITTTVGWSIV